MLALIERGRAGAVSEAAAHTPPRPEPQQLALVTKLMNLARETAQHAKVNAELLATSRDVEQLVFSRRTDQLPAAGDARSSANRWSRPRGSRE